jgi:Glyoxalase/Bleomycin resistance protein/Dioxygenase superfamily
MSRFFGEFRQVGLVVRDIEQAMKHWVEVCGIGPWFFVDKMPFTEFIYRGERQDDIHVSIALANSGGVQLELIQQKCRTPSMYRDFLNAGHEGMQHWSSWPVNYDQILDRALSSGYGIGQQGNGSRGRFVYLWNGGHPGTIIEMAHLTEARERVFDGIRAAAIDWDGSEPIREAWPS